MGFSELPNELILDIVQHLDKQKHSCAIARVNWRLYRLLKDGLLRFNIRFRGGGALTWVAEKGHLETAHKFLRLGANINTTGTQPLGTTPLYAAAANGRLAMVKMLLKMGANPEAGGYGNQKPLYAALVSRNEEIARLFLDKMSSVDVSIAEPEQDQTALHVACLFRLPKSAQYLLECGANVNKSTTQASTPLSIVLHSGVFYSRNTFCDDTLKIVLLLLEFGANPNEETCALGLEHPDPRVRGLFQTGGITENKADRVLIGRSWMTSNTECEENQFCGEVCMNWKRFLPTT
jgi:ankyrin repeat protein